MSVVQILWDELSFMGLFKFITPGMSSGKNDACLGFCFDV